MMQAFFFQVNGTSEIWLHYYAVFNNVLEVLLHTLVKFESSVIEIIFCLTFIM